MVGQPRLQQEAQQLHGQLQGVMRTFGRTCRGQQKVYVALVRKTEKQLLAIGRRVRPMAREGLHTLGQAGRLPQRQRTRLQQRLDQAIQHYESIARQSRRLIQGKQLDHAKIVNAYDHTITAILKGKSNCPAQFGKKPGLIAEMATGFIFGVHLPQGNPEDASYMMPLIDQVQQAIQRMQTPRKPRIQSVAGDLAFSQDPLRDQLHARDILTVGIPYTIEPAPVPPTDSMIAHAQHAVPWTRIPSATQVKIAYACGYSRPFVESLIETLSARGGTHLKYKGHRGAYIQTVMAVLATNGATLGRIQQHRLTKRAQKFRRFFRLKPPNSLQDNTKKNK